MARCAVRHHWNDSRNSRLENNHANGSGTNSALGDVGSLGSADRHAQEVLGQRLSHLYSTIELSDDARISAVVLSMGLRADFVGLD